MTAEANPLQGSYTTFTDERVCEKAANTSGLEIPSISADFRDSTHCTSSTERILCMQYPSWTYQRVLSRVRLVLQVQIVHISHIIQISPPQ